MPNDTSSNSKSLSGNHLMLMLYWLYKSLLQFTKLKPFHMQYSVTDVANRTDISSSKKEMKTFTNKNLKWLLHNSG